MQTVAVLRGGPSREHEVSLRTGAAMLANLAPDRYEGRDIYIDKAGQWHLRGKPITPERALRQVDVAMLGLHGEYGEDGGMQRMLERLGVPYTGADPIGSFLAMHKVLTKEKAREIGLLTPEYKFIQTAGDTENIVRDAIRSLAQPVVVKPLAWGSSVGVSIVGGYAPVLGAAEKLFALGATGVLIEEYIKGREATAGVVENFRSESLYALPPIEIIPPEGDFFSYQSKYTQGTREICPGRFHRKVTETLQKAAQAIHKALGLRHYSRSDFIVADKGVYFLEVNASAAVGLTPDSLFPKSLAAVGVPLPDFLTHLVNLALAR